MATTVLGDECECVMFACRFDKNATTLQPLAVLGVELLNIDALTMQSELQYEGWLHVSARIVKWGSGRFDDVLLAIAENDVTGITFANLNTETIYAPYDGGADLILASSSSAKIARYAWQDCLSSRADGL